jgi:hypothetical protein
MKGEPVEFLGRVRPQAPQDFRPKFLTPHLEATITPEIGLEPFRCQTRHFLQGIRSLKQMARSRDDSQVFFRVAAISDQHYAAGFGGSTRDPSSVTPFTGMWTAWLNSFWSMPISSIVCHLNSGTCSAFSFFWRFSLQRQKSDARLWCCRILGT